jgi:hypothetical protein
LVEDLTPMYSPLEFSKRLATPPSSTALPPKIQGEVLPVVSESSTTRPDSATIRPGGRIVAVVVEVTVVVSVEVRIEVEVTVEAVVLLVSAEERPELLVRSPDESPRSTAWTSDHTATRVMAIRTRATAA